MGGGDLLLRAVLCDPADDTVRLAYADWLDENGEPERAEFIRGQVLPLVGRVDLTHYSGAACRCRTCLTVRRDARFTFRMVGWADGNPYPAVGSETHDLRWVVPGGEILAKYARGFVSSVSCSLGTFARCAADIFARHPVCSVSLSDLWTLYQFRGPGYSGPIQLRRGRAAGEVPPVVWRHLAGGGGRKRVADYEASWRAGVALLAACLDAGRELAGLPPLRAA